MRIGLIGYGAVGRSIVAALRAENRPDEVVGILVRAGRAAELVRDGLPAVETLAELLARKPRVVAETAGHAAVAAFGPPVLQGRSDLLIASIGALVDDSLRERLTSAAQLAGRQILLPAGAVGGIDAIFAMRLAGLRRVLYRSRKPPSAWRDSPAESAIDLDHLSRTTTFYRGSARIAAGLYPKNANVAATIALAGLGLDATLVEMVADPTISDNIHEIEAEGASGYITIRLQGRPSPDNPKTSALTPFSVLRGLFNLEAPIAI